MSRLATYVMWSLLVHANVWQYFHITSSVWLQYSKPEGGTGHPSSVTRSVTRGCTEGMIPSESTCRSGSWLERHTCLYSWRRRGGLVKRVNRRTAPVSTMSEAPRATHQQLIPRSPATTEEFWRSSHSRRTDVCSSYSTAACTRKERLVVTGAKGGKWKKYWKWRKLNIWDLGTFWTAVCMVLSAGSRCVQNSVIA